VLNTYSDYNTADLAYPTAEVGLTAAAAYYGVIPPAAAAYRIKNVLTRTAVRKVANYISPRFTPRTPYTPRSFTRSTKTPSFNRSPSKYSRQMPLRRSRYGARRRRFGSRSTRPRGRQVGRLQSAGRWRRGRTATLAPELKFMDLLSSSALSSADMDWNILVPSQNLIVRGTGQSQRIGRKAILKSLDLRFHMYRTTYSAVGGTVAPVNPVSGGGLLTMYVVLDRQANGATGDPTGTLEQGTGVLNTGSSVLGTNSSDQANFIQLATKDRYRILKKITYRVPDCPITAVTWDPAITNNNEFTMPAWVGPTKAVHLKLRDLPIEYSGADGAVTDNPEVITNVRSNNIFIMSQFETLAVAAVPFYINVHSRLRFIG